MVAHHAHQDLPGRAPDRPIEAARGRAGHVGQQARGAGRATVRAHASHAIRSAGVRTGHIREGRPLLAAQYRQDLRASSMRRRRWTRRSRSVSAWWTGLVRRSSRQAIDTGSCSPDCVPTSRGLWSRMPISRLWRLSTDANSSRPIATSRASRACGGATLSPPCKAQRHRDASPPPGLLRQERERTRERPPSRVTHARFRFAGARRDARGARSADGRVPRACRREGRSRPERPRRHG